MNFMQICNVIHVASFCEISVVEAMDVFDFYLGACMNAIFNEIEREARAEDLRNENCFCCGDTLSELQIFQLLLFA